MALGRPDTTGNPDLSPNGTLRVSAIVSMAEACKIAEETMGRLDHTMIIGEQKRAIAQLLLRNHDTGIEGHNYGDKKQPMSAVLHPDMQVADRSNEEELVITGAWTLD